jgi:hypothetical protein
LYAVTESAKYEDYWFFEVDLDTEAPSRVIRKCEVYVTYYQSGNEQQQTDIFPFVVWLTPNKKRQATILKYIQQELGDYSKLFTVITAEDLDTLISTGIAPVGIGQA